MEPLEPLPETVDQAAVDAATSVARRVGANIRRASTWPNGSPSMREIRNPRRSVELP